MNKISFFIGANNSTGKVEKTKINEVLGKKLDGYTIIDTVGIWKGSKEKSVKVEVIANMSDKEVLELVSDLKIACKQDCIIVEKSQVSVKFL